ncbi:MAG TPA: hypothetical protein VNL37_03730, partial [Candidatus Polarisedimenticolia bacterium]|nr:hypothetical protein [Candidatus Polarisedimenticolia bacterium]
LRRGRSEDALAIAVAGAMAAMVLVGSVGGAIWSRAQRARLFCATMAAKTPPGEPVAVEASKFEQYMFYTLRRTAQVESDAGLLDLLSSGRWHYAIVMRQRYERLRATDPVDRLAVLAEAPINDVEYVLVGPGPSGQPGAAAEGRTASPSCPRP